MEKRFFQRARVGVAGEFYVKSDDPSKTELVGTIEDICENGIGITVKGEQYKDSISKMKKGDIIGFQAIDEYELFNEIKTDVIFGNAKVVRIAENRDEIVIGCEIKRMSPELSDYVANKKLSIFYQNDFKVDK